MDQSQERIGHAVVHVARVQDGYREAAEAVQEHLGAVAMAGIRTEPSAAGESKMKPGEQGYRKAA